MHFSARFPRTAVTSARTVPSNRGNRFRKGCSTVFSRSNSPCPVSQLLSKTYAASHPAICCPLSATLLRPLSSRSTKSRFVLPRPYASARVVPPACLLLNPRSLRQVNHDRRHLLKNPKARDPGLGRCLEDLHAKCPLPGFGTTQCLRGGHRAFGRRRHRLALHHRSCRPSPGRDGSPCATAFRPATCSQLPGRAGGLGSPRKR